MSAADSPSGGAGTTLVDFGSGKTQIHDPAGEVVSGSHLFVSEHDPNLIKEFSLSGQLQAIWMP